MPNSINSDNNEFSISELQKKLVNIEETSFTEKGMKSIFGIYNTTKENNSNSVERLNKNELDVLVNDIKKYDKDKSGTIDIDEANAFANDFNQKHSGQQIKGNDLFNFVKNIFKRYDYYNNNESSEFVNQDLTVGSPLSEKTVQMKLLIDGEIKTIKIKIELYATNNKRLPHQYLFGAIEGKEYIKNLADEYGYEGVDAFNKFMEDALRKPNSSDYSVNFSPQYRKRGSTTDGATTTVDTITTKGNTPTEENIFIVPHGFDKDPRLIQEQYENEDVQATIENFCNFLEESIKTAETNLDEYLKTYGFTEKGAELFSKIWNNKYSSISRGNTEEQIREMLDNAKKLLANMRNADNSLEGVLTHKDFGSYFKELTGGLEFKPRELQAFMDDRKEFIRKETAISTYKYVHENFDNVIKKFESAYKNLRKNDAIKKGIDVEQSLPAYMRPKESLETEIDSQANRKYQEAYNDLYETFHAFIGVSRENWDAMMKECEKKGINPLDFIKHFATGITDTIDAQTKEALGIDNLKNIDSYEEHLKDSYEYNSAHTLGRGDLIRRVDDYHSSQVIGGAVASAVTQLALYSIGLAYMGTFAKAVSAGTTLSQGTVSGLSYAGSYLAVDITERATNGIDNSEDLYSVGAVREMAGNATIEFFAGKLFDGILKDKYFGKIEKAALQHEKDFFTITGETFLKTTSTRFSKKEITDIVGVRGIAAAVGGTKDGTKESFKESLMGKYSLNDIGAAFIVGAISNAFFIKFKNSTFAKNNHKVLGKFVEKSPKKGIKNDLKYAQEVLSPEEQQDFMKFLNDIKTTIKEGLTQHLGKAGYSNAEEFIKNNDNELNKIIIDYYILEYLVPYNN